MNITDVDDKILARAKERGVDPLELAREFEEKFYEDMEALDIRSVNLYARASEHIPEMIEQIETLLEKGYAYQVDGDVYYDISKFPDYGRLSRQRPEELVKHRVKVEPGKRNPQDFALWKRKKPGEAISWKAPWGEGRPGWHIEDTAITTTYLGNRYDIHGGAIELAFPHHEAEIAQAEAATGEKPFVKYWLHTGILNVKGQKMAKSLGNFVTIREALAKYDREVLRLFFASTHYRSPIDYREESLKMAEESLERLYNTLEAVEEMKEVEKVGG